MALASDLHGRLATGAWGSPASHNMCGKVLLCRGQDFCACGAALRGIGRVCDGVPEVRRCMWQYMHAGIWSSRPVATVAAGVPTRRGMPQHLQVRRAARDELRKGAHCIKVMASGGVASPTDRWVHLAV